MKEVNFSTVELAFLRHRFEIEFEEAKDYVENIRSVLRSIRASKTLAETEPVVEEQNKTLRKPSVEMSSVTIVTDTGVKKRRTRSDKGKKRNKKGQKGTLATAMSETERDFLIKKEASQSVASKKPAKRKMRKGSKKRGVFLARMG
jgi:hypothetical protein